MNHIFQLIRPRYNTALGYLFVLYLIYFSDKGQMHRESLRSYPVSIFLSIVLMIFIFPYEITREAFYIS